MFSKIIKYIRNVTMSKKYEMRVIHTYNEAFEVGSEYIANIENRSDTPRLSNGTNSNYPSQLYDENGKLLWNHYVIH